MPGMRLCVAHSTPRISSSLRYHPSPDGCQIWFVPCRKLGYGALLMFVPFNGYPGGTVLRTANLARYVDEWVLGDFLFYLSYIC